jgi:ATP phosphoribosyltransferase regulatory subunit
MVQLLAQYLAVVDIPQRAFDRIWQITQQAGIDIEAPLKIVRSHAAALIALSPKAEVVFEMTGIDGNVLASGGEYDRLLDRLGADGPVTASGCALWTERLEQEAQRTDG